MSVDRVLWSVGIRNENAIYEVHLFIDFELLSDLVPSDVVDYYMSSRAVSRSKQFHHSLASPRNRQRLCVVRMDSNPFYDRGIVVRQPCSRSILPVAPRTHPGGKFHDFCIKTTRTLQILQYIGRIWLSLAV